MVKKSNINWTLQGKPVKPTTLKAELIESYEYELFQTVNAVVVELENLLKRLQKRSSDRGQGFLAVRYNDPLNDTEVEIKSSKNDGTIKVFVPVGVKGSAGYKFNLLDQGRPPIVKPKDGNPMTFPSYDGTLTKAAGDTSVLNRKRVVSPSVAEGAPAWISTYSVKAVTPRKFYEAILAKRKFKNSRVFSKTLKKLGKIVSAKPPKFKWHPGTVKIKITRNGK